MNIGRIVIAILITLLLMPCMGFFVFGFLASYEVGPSERWPWQIGYGALELLAIACVVTAWWFAFRKIRQPNECQNCGFVLRGNTSGQCPECGAAIRKQTGS